MPTEAFFSFEFWRDCLRTGADLLFRVPAGLRLPVLAALPDGSYLSEVVTHQARGTGFRIPLDAVGDPRNATRIRVWVIEYTVSAGRPVHAAETFRLIATIMDPDDVTAVELAAGYDERWEYEISLREIETQMLEPGGGLRGPAYQQARRSRGRSGPNSASFWKGLPWAA